MACIIWKDCFEFYVLVITQMNSVPFCIFLISDSFPSLNYCTSVHKLVCFNILDFVACVLFLIKGNSCCGSILYFTLVEAFKKLYSPIYPYPIPSAPFNQIPFMSYIVSSIDWRLQLYVYSVVCCTTSKAWLFCQYWCKLFI